VARRLADDALAALRAAAAPPEPAPGEDPGAG
jgi:hypothetical protein